MAIRYVFPLPVLLLGLVFTMAGCDDTPTEVEEYQHEPVLHSYLITGEPFEEVWLEWIAKDIESLYIPEDNGISGVEMVVYPVLDATGTNVDSAGMAVYYEEDANHKGHYLASETDTVRAGWRYRIEVKKEDEVEIQAETTAPDTFALSTTYSAINSTLDTEPADINNMPDSLTFTREMPFLQITWSDAFNDVSYASEAKGGYIFILTALADTANLEQLDPDWDPVEDPIEPDDMWLSLYTFAPDYQNSMDIIWIFFNWAGPYRVETQAVSCEYYRYMFTQFANPTAGNVPRPESNVNGGLGCFGALSSHFFHLNMEKVGD